MEFKDYYKILGVETDADRKAIKTAYRRLARKYHPDVSKESDASAKFKEVSEAYDVLGNDEKRAEYDQLRQYGGPDGNFTPPPGWQGGQRRTTGFEFGGAGGGGDFSDFFEAFFGGSGGRGFASGERGRRPGGGFTGGDDIYSTRGQDLEVDMPVFLEETLKEESRTIEFKLPHYGTGGPPREIKKTLKVKIPRGVADGERIRLKGQGSPGFGEGPPGDLYLRIRLVPHPLFDVIGRDLAITVPIAPWEAALGAKITVPTLNGKISLSVTPGNQTGARLRIKGKGLPNRTGQGDLYVILKVVMPETVSAEAKTLWQQLADKAGFDPRAELRADK
ncbi:MAG: DnaJ C-terminal domain-containing protein [Pseudohongiellaceae bacterium]